MLRDMRQQECIEARRPVVLRRASELVWCERRQSARPRCAHAAFVRIDPYALSRQMQQVPTDPAADFERESRLEAPEVPAERRLDVEPLLPAGGLEVNQAFCIFLAASRSTC